jgi:hypothetical protein
MVTFSADKSIKNPHNDQKGEQNLTNNFPDLSYNIILLQKERKTTLEALHRNNIRFLKYALMVEKNLKS